MLFCSLLALSLISRPVSALSVEPSTSATNTAPNVTSSSPGHSLDAGNLGSTIGGASAAAVAVITIALAFAMLHWSRRRNCAYHNKELTEIVPSLPYWNRNVNVEATSVNTSELDLPFPVPAMLPPTSHKTDTPMREIHFGEPPAYSLQTSTSSQPFSLGITNTSRPS